MYRKRTYVWMRVLTRDTNCQSAYTLNSPFDSLTLERLTQRECVSIGGGRGERRSTSDCQSGYVTGAEFRSCFNSGHSSDHPDHTEATHHDTGWPRLPCNYSFRNYLQLLDSPEIQRLTVARTAEDAERPRYHGSISPRNIVSADDGLVYTCPMVHLPISASSSGRMGDHAPFIQCAYKMTACVVHVPTLASPPTYRPLLRIRGRGCWSPPCIFSSLPSSPFPVESRLNFPMAVRTQIIPRSP
jgi:hypothetical protein